MAKKNPDSSSSPAGGQAWKALRKRAEKIIREKAISAEGRSWEARLGADFQGFPEEMQRTLHELRVHQIELELQNEELRRAQEALEALKERYFNLYDLAPVGYVVLSERGLILEANLTVATLLGEERGSLIKKPITRFILPEDQDIYYRHRKPLFEKGEPQACELRMRRKDGSFFWARLEATVAQAAADASIVCRAVISDVSEVKRAESQREAVLEEVARKAKELQEKNDELTRFTYAVSHDLRSPLVTVKTFLGHLEDDLRNRNQERVGEDLGFIQGAADRMGRLLDELLRLSRVGRLINPAVDVSLQAVVNEALDVTAGRIAQRGVRIEVTNEPVVLFGDPARLAEIFQNLVDNAAKFMGGQPEPRIEIGVERVDRETVLFVRDNGIGLDPNFSSRLFGLFEKFDAATDGVGLGLALVRRIIELHGGRIWAESEGPSRGSTFRFTLAKTRWDSGKKDKI